MVLAGLFLLLALGATLDLDALFAGTLATSHQQGVGLTAMADRNLTQALGVVNTNLVQAQGGVADDPAVFGSLQTSSRVPVQGSNDLPK